MSSNNGKVHLTRPVGVTRVDRGYSKGYQVSFTHRGRRVSKFFGDKRHHGPIYAWAAACTYLFEQRQESRAPWKYQWAGGELPPRSVRQ